VAARLRLLGLSRVDRAAIAGRPGPTSLERCARNIEHFIGTVQIPLGVIGPLRVNGLFAQGDYYVPLATSEAALVASHHRGARLITESGGCTAVLLNDGLSRVPGFAFKDLVEAGRFVAWVVHEFEQFRQVAAETTSHGELVDMKVTIEGNHVYIHFEFTSGDAAGQNMVTIATAALCRHIHDHSPVAPTSCLVEANLSGDKKACFQSFQATRGKKVTAEVTVAADLVSSRLRTSPAAMIECWRMCAVGAALSGTIGLQGQYANGLAAVYVACGQDVACVAESAVGLTRLEVTAAGDLYASVTLPNLIVGTVGGGTGLPSQKACLSIMGLAGPGNAAAFAEVCGGLCLAGELSLIGAMSAGEFARAHRRLARWGLRDVVAARTGAGRFPVTGRQHCHA
jgi:hydroxymethylglutaryl-CoA reductase (NADPH)